MEGSGDAEITVATGMKTEAPLELDEQRNTKKARVESEENKVDPTNTQGGSHSMTNPSAPPELKDGTGE
jgi:hypothetical protein